MEVRVHRTADAVMIKLTLAENTCFEISGRMCVRSETATSACSEVAMSGLHTNCRRTEENGPARLAVSFSRQRVASKLIFRLTTHPR